MSAPPGGPPAGPRLTALDRAPRADAHERDEHYQPVFVNARRKELDELLTRYPSKMAALLPALWIVQEERGWVSEPGDGGSRRRAGSHARLRQRRRDVLHHVSPAPGREILRPGVHDVAL